ncbi:MAG TPA: response regulator [Candidatus Saccharimonadales bacterium]|nr:response regulator [Candidatus Saccharimonadales bacterium]
MTRTLPNSATILVVEDERTLNEAYQIILERAGYAVYSAFDGQQALAVAAEHEPDLILLDLRMPHMDGLQFLREYDLKHHHPKVKVVLFSNYDMQAEIDEAYRQGADRYILKAWASPKELLRLVQSTLGAPKTETKTTRKATAKGR